MRAAVFMGREEVVLQDRPVPRVGPRDVLIEVRDCGICGSDLTAYRTGNYEPGIVIGHEFSGVVKEAGDEVDSVSRGEPVVGNAIIPCGRCRYCRQDRPSLCEDLEMTGITIDGAFADYVLLPEDVVYQIPQGLSFKSAAMVDPLATVLRGLRLSSLKAGDFALVQGAGPIGLLTLQAAKAAGATEVWVTEVNDARLQAASQLGAVEAINPLEVSIEILLERRGIEGPDVIFDCTGSPETLALDPTLVRKGGEIVLLGICEEPVEADFFTPVLNELTIRGSYCGFDEYPMALRMLSEGRIETDLLITSLIHLEDIVVKGFEPLSRGSTDIKVMVEVSS